MSIQLTANNSDSNLNTCLGNSQLDMDKEEQDNTGQVNLYDHRHIYQDQQPVEYCADHFMDPRLSYTSLQQFRVQSPTSGEDMRSPEFCPFTPNFQRDGDKSSENKTVLQNSHHSYILNIQNGYGTLFGSRTRNSNFQQQQSVFHTGQTSNNTKQSLTQMLQRSPDR